MLTSGMLRLFMADIDPPEHYRPWWTHDLRTYYWYNTKTDVLWERYRTTTYKERPRKYHWKVWMKRASRANIDDRADLRWFNGDMWGPLRTAMMRDRLREMEEAGIALKGHHFKHWKPDCGYCD
jgi:hypothetical protein